MHECVVSNNVYGAWVQLLSKLINNGRSVSPRGIPTREILNVTLEFPMEANIIAHPIRNLNYKFMVAEWLWIAFGHSELRIISQYNMEMARFSDDGVSLYGAYGPRWNGQYGQVARLLRDDFTSRQAVIVIWRENPIKSKDVPCTLTFQFFIRDDKLDMTVNMRSSDVWLGIPYDVFTFTQLGNVMAALLEVPRGQFVMNLGSSHLYLQNEEAAIRVLRDYDQGYDHRSPAIEKPLSRTLDTILQHPDPKITRIYECNAQELIYAHILQMPKKEAEENLVRLARFP